ncbi:MAG TPA: DUF885 domain-containing protein, partial [Blastocatellia bacterium]|nr:DUF885 domain-containing protein [Blastocatellia bacterium]
MIRNIAVLTTILMLATTLLGQVASSGEVSTKLHTLFEEDWEWRLREFPEMATYNGDPRYNDRLTDRSPEAIERRKAHDREMLERISKIDRSKLSGQDLVSYDLYLEDKKQDIEGHRFPFELMPVNQMQGIQIDFPQLVSSSPFRNAKDYENYLARLAAFPKAVDQVIALMRRGIESKWVFPAVPLRSVPSQIEGQIVADATKSPIYQPFESFPSEMAEADRARLAESGRRSISENVMPALKKLLAFFKDSYLPAAPSEISASSMPDGAAYYVYMARAMTTTSLSPKEIHEIGQKEVARIRKEMEAIIRQVGFKGSFQDFLTFLRTDERFYYKKAEDLVTGYRDIAKRADGKLPEL